MPLTSTLCKKAVRNRFDSSETVDADSVNTIFPFRSLRVTLLGLRETGVNCRVLRSVPKHAQ